MRTPVPVDPFIPTQTSILLETSTPDVITTHTLQPEIAYEDTGYEGYYTGIVVITEYYTLLSNKLLKEAYNKLSVSEQNKISFIEFTQLNEDLINEIATIKPFIVWQIEQGISPLVADKEDQISFFVELLIWEDSTSANKNSHALFVNLIKEGKNWKINSVSESLATFVLETTTSPELDIGSVPNRGYYDSILTITQYYLFNNYSLYEKAYDLLSPFRPHTQNFEEYLNYYLSYIRETENIQAIEILSIRPFYDGELHFQYITTPNPDLRRKFIVALNYVKGENTATEEISIQSRFITTVFENKKWRVYSINTSP